MTMRRRVVTGQDGSAASGFVSDEMVDASVFSGSGHSIHQIWGADEPRSFPDSGELPSQGGPLPPAGGYRFAIFNVSPDATAESPGIHATDSTDIVVVLNGEVDLELDGGEIRTLRVGDTLVQNGTPHRWINRSGHLAQLAVFTVGGNSRT